MRRPDTYQSEGRPVKSATGRRIGHIIGDRFVKHATAERHMLLNPKGWAIDRYALKKLRRAGVKEVVVVDDNAGKIYTATLSSFLSFGRLVDRGYGEQLVLTLDKWEVTNR